MRALPILTIMAAWAGLTTPAVAAKGGAIVDPGSPVDKEYAIPFEQARQDAGGASRVVDAAQARRLGTSAPLFGVGIIGAGPRPAGNESGTARVSAGHVPPTTDTSTAEAAAAAGQRQGDAAATRITWGIPLAAALVAGALWLGRRQRTQHRR